MDGKYVEIACTAYASRSEDKRDTLLNIVMPYITRLNYEQQLEIELKLANTIKRDYKQHYFQIEYLIRICFLMEVLNFEIVRFEIALLRNVL